MAESESASDSGEVSSVLSDNQRKWLRGKDPYESPDRHVRSRMRKRYKQVFSDLALLHNSERMGRGELMKAVRDADYDSTPNINSSLASETEIEPEDVAEMLESVIAQLETVSGTPFEEFGLADLMTQIRKVKGRHGELSDDMVPVFAVMGAYAGLLGTGKTEKQARQWIEHHWPDRREALEQLEEAEAVLESF